MRWVWHVARMGDGERRTIFWLENLRGRDNLEDLDVGRRTILGWILGK